MIDIEGVLLEAARAKTQDWTRYEAISVAKGISESLDGILDWDAGAGEQWARIIVAGRVVSIVSITLPLVISQTSVPHSWSTPIRWTHLVVPSMEEPILTGRIPVLDDVFGTSSRLEVLDPSGFSADDLWYSTV